MTTVIKYEAYLTWQKGENEFIALYILRIYVIVVIWFLSDLENKDVVLNDAGKMIKKWYCELGNKFPDIQCDEYVIMPDHFHAIIINVGADLPAATSASTASVSAQK